MATPAIGSPFQVNTFAAGDQDTAAIAMDSTGNFVVVWESFDQDGSFDGIYAQRYSNAGLPQGTEFRVNTSTNLTQGAPNVAMDAAGNFVVVWGGFDSSVTGDSIFAQRYTATGIPVGGEFKVSTADVFLDGDADVAMDRNGNFVVTWEQSDSNATLTDIYARRFSQDGTPLGSPFRVNTITNDSQIESAIAIDSSGNIIVAWQGAEQNGNNFDVFAQRFSSTGIPLGGEFRVNTSTTGFQGVPSIAIDAVGNVAIVWQDDFLNGEAYGIGIQQYDSAGNPRGREILIDPGEVDETPAVAMSQDGDFIVTWHQRQRGVLAQRFGRNGEKLGPEFLVNPSSPRFNRPQIASDPVGNYTIIWQDERADGDGYGVFAQRLLDTTLIGTEAGETITGTAFNDFIDGAGGNDTLLGLANNDTIVGGAGNDLINGGLGSDSLRGGVGNDQLLGQGGNDNLSGDAGNDILRGGNGNDIINGGVGADLLEGGFGVDILRGGIGADRFVLARRQGRDLIQGFENGRDRLALTGNLRFSNLTITRQGASTLISVGRDRLALLQGIAPVQITIADFVFI